MVSTYYHAHIYWKNDSEMAIAKEVREDLKSKGFFVGTMHNRPIGPHPLPSFEVDFDSSSKEYIVNYLKSFQLAALIHEYSGVDHVKDHTENVLWINEELVLDIEFLRNFG